MVPGAVALEVQSELGEDLVAGWDRPVRRVVLHGREGSRACRARSCRSSRRDAIQSIRSTVEPCCFRDAEAEAGAEHDHHGEVIGRALEEREHVLIGRHDDLAARVPGQPDARHGSRSDLAVEVRVAQRLADEAARPSRPTAARVECARARSRTPVARSSSAGRWCGSAEVRLDLAERPGRIPLSVVDARIARHARSHLVDERDPGERRIDEHAAVTIGLGIARRSARRPPSAGTSPIERSRGLAPVALANEDLPATLVLADARHQTVPFLAGRIRPILRAIRSR